MAESKIEPPKIEKMQATLLKFIGPITIKGVGSGEIRTIEGVKDMAELWQTDGEPHKLLEIVSANFISIGETILTVRSAMGILEIEHRQI